MWWETILQVMGATALLTAAMTCFVVTGMFWEDHAKIGPQNPVLKVMISTALVSVGAGCAAGSSMIWYSLLTAALGI